MFCSTVSAGTRAFTNRTGFTNCTRNTFSVGATDSCDTCPDGGHSNEGASTCDFCSTGEYYDAIANTCEACPAGTHSEKGAPDLPGCLACDGPGQFSSAGAGYCATAGAGNKANADHTGQEQCPVNTYSTGSADSCASCGTGFSKKGSSSCERCGAGTYFNSTSNTCAECPAGTVSLTGARDVEGCEACERGSTYERERRLRTRTIR